MTEKEFRELDHGKKLDVLLENRLITIGEDPFANAGDMLEMMKQFHWAVESDGREYPVFLEDVSERLTSSGIKDIYIVAAIACLRAVGGIE